VGSSYSSQEPSTTLYYGRIRPSRLPLHTVKRKCARLDAGSTSPSAPAPWRCGARQPTIGLGQTADRSSFGRVIYAKYVSAAPSGAVAGRRRPIATCRQWAPSRPGVTSAANDDGLRSNTARYGSAHGGLAALGSRGSLHAAPVVPWPRRGSSNGRRRRATGAARRARWETNTQPAHWKHNPGGRRGIAMIYGV